MIRHDRNAMRAHRESFLEKPELNLKGLGTRKEGKGINGLWGGGYKKTVHLSNFFEMKTGINNHDLLSQCGVYGISKTSINDIAGKADKY